MYAHKCRKAAARLARIVFLPVGVGRANQSSAVCTKAKSKSERQLMAEIVSWTSVPRHIIF